MTAKTLMIQGTASSVGKSLLVAALCRIFKQDGLRVAPFKSQNMALNSFVTSDGGEMGRAQVVQAMAAGILPTVEMNPILLKPEADHRSQVVVMGRAQGNSGFRDYRSRREELLGIVEGALNRLRDQYDLVIIEGAGSPAEINLKAGEIVNMRIARMASAPVLLAGDIDRGGVFAHLVGTLELLDPDERQMIKGFLINKFRGDVSLLKPGLDYLEQRTGTPVLGVIPYIGDVALPEEDSVALETRRRVAPGGEAGSTATIVDVAVIELPHIANFDDFDPLAAEPGVRVRYVNSPATLGSPDLIIIPGTKTTISDLQWLRDRGLDGAIMRHARDGRPVIGICGGFQMLGHQIEDPEGAESAPGSVATGLGLLPATTVFAPVKATHQVQAQVASGQTHGLLRGCDGLMLTGYEIHMGHTRQVQHAGTESGHRDPRVRGQPNQETAPFVILARSGRPPTSNEPTADGLLSADGQVLGTYLHGLFDSPALRRILLTNLAAASGREHAAAQHQWGQLATLETQFERLAAHVRASLDMPRLYQIVGL